MTLHLVIEQAAERGFIVRESDRIVAAFSTARELGDYVARRGVQAQPDPVASAADDPDDIPRVARSAPAQPVPPASRGIVHRIIGGSAT